LRLELEGVARVGSPVCIRVPAVALATAAEVVELRRAQRRVPTRAAGVACALHLGTALFGLRGARLDATASRENLVKRRVAV
jgi:hypothetical protein